MEIKKEELRKGTPAATPAPLDDDALENASGGVIGISPMPVVDNLWWCTDCGKWRDMSTPICPECGRKK